MVKQSKDLSPNQILWVIVVIGLTMFGLLLASIYVSAELELEVEAEVDLVIQQGEYIRWHVYGEPGENFTVTMYEKVANPASFRLLGDSTSNLTIPSSGHIMFYYNITEWYGPGTYWFKLTDSNGTKMGESTIKVVPALIEPKSYDQQFDDLYLAIVIGAILLGGSLFLMVMHMVVTDIRYGKGKM